MLWSYSNGNNPEKADKEKISTESYFKKTPGRDNYTYIDLVCFYYLVQTVGCKSGTIQSGIDHGCIQPDPGNFHLYCSQPPEAHPFFFEGK